MSWKEFFIKLLGLASCDVGIGFILYIGWKYIDLKYFSTFDVETLKIENKYLREQNKKIGEDPEEFWNESDMK